jgi:hypothetical protein
MATKMIVTFIHRKVEGDAHFPEIDWSQWTPVWRRKAETERQMRAVERA